MINYQESYECIDEKNENNSCDLNNQSIMTFEDEKRDFREQFENLNIFSESNRPTDESDDKEERNDIIEHEMIENEIIGNEIIENEKIEEENNISTPNNDDMYIISKDDNVKSGQEEDEIEGESDKFLSKKTDRGNKTKTTKCSDDNIRRKCKHIVIDLLLEFINRQICFFYNNNIGKGICIKQLQNLSQKQKSESNIEFNKQMLNKSIGEIFSEISGRYTNFSPKHNYNLIQSLLNDADVNIRNYFNKLFRLTFLQCFKHFRGTEYHEELNGMRLLKEELNSYSIEDEDYLGTLKHYFLHYEEIINNKKSRKSKKSKTHDNNDK